MVPISVREEIIKIIDERETQEKNKGRKKEEGGGGGGRGRDRSCSEKVRAKLFYCAFKLGFLQLICKASLIFKSTLGLALSIISKQRELYESKHVAVKCRCLKI